MAVEQGSSAPDFTLPDTHGTPVHLADFWPHGETARAFGVLDEGHGRALRGSFLIDADGLVRWSVVNPPGQARDFEGYRAALAAL